MPIAPIIASAGRETLQAIYSSLLNLVIHSPRVEVDYISPTAVVSFYVLRAVTNGKWSPMENGFFSRRIYDNHTVARQGVDNDHGVATPPPVCRLEAEVHEHGLHATINHRAKEDC